MKIDWCFLAEAANSDSGKLNALGIGIDNLAAASFPITLPVLYVICHLNMEDDPPPPQLSIRYTISNPTGVVVAEMTSVAALASSNAQFKTANLVTAFGNVLF
ncbi:MAG TPA: hypothetical protein VGO93_22935, partial [Candidatus Xenobia bacterium]